MVIEINTVVSVGPIIGRNLPNITLEDAKFFGRPNFSGEMDRFKDDRRKFTVLIPNDVADQLRAIGYNVKTNIPTAEQLAENPDLAEISFIKVMVDDSSDVWVKMGDQEPTKIAVSNYGLMDRSRIEVMDMEIRAWNYNKEEVDAGIETPKYSARLVSIIAVLTPNRLQEKYGNLG